MHNIDLFLYINLDKRTDRRKEIEEEFQRIGIDVKKVHRLSANENPQRPEVGCSSSHIKAMEYIMQLPKNVKTVLVMEDDFSFCDDANLVHESFNKLFDGKSQDFWDVIFLSYRIKQRKDYDDLLSISLKSATASGYLIKRDYAPTLLENYIEGYPLLLTTGQHWLYAVDVYWNKLPHTGRWFYFNKPLGHQRYSFSSLGLVYGSVESKFVNE